MRDFGPHVHVSTQDYVANIILDRAPHNFVSAGVLAGLADALDVLGEQRLARVVVLEAAGKNFSAGADLGSSADDLGGGGHGVEEFYRHALRLYSSSLPIVAAVQGAAIGAGLGLALVADFRVASAEAKFSANFVKLGFHAGFGISLTLPRLIGLQNAQRMLLTGCRVEAEEARTWGLVDQVVEHHDLKRSSMLLAQEIAANAPLAVASTRATLRRDLVRAVATQIEHEAREQAWLRETADFTEGVRAVGQRRIAEFTGT